MAAPKSTVSETDAAIAALYSQLAGQAKSGVNVTGQNFNAASQQVGSIYDQMTAALTQQANATAGGLGNQFNMLGIGAATDSATENLRGQLNQSLVSAARRRATEMSGLTQQGAAYKASGLEGVTNIGREGAQVRSESRTRLEEAIAALEAAKAEAQGQYDIQKLQGDIQLAQMRARSGGGGGGGGRSGSPLDMLRAQLLGLQIMEKQQDLEGGGDEMWGKRGQGGLNNFLNNPSPYWDVSAGKKFRGEIYDLLDMASSQAASKLGDPYVIASGGIVESPSYLNRDALRQAMQIYFGKA